MKNHFKQSIRRSMKKPIYKHSKHQTGAILAAALMFLVVMTLLGLGLSRSTIMEEKMARNAKEQMLSMQAAEAVLRDAESWLKVQGSLQPNNIDPASPVFPATTVQGFTPMNFVNFVNTNGQDYGSLTGQSALPTNIMGAAPTFFISEFDVTNTNGTVITAGSLLTQSTFGAPSNATYYYVTGSHRGTNNITQTVVQSVFVRR